MRRLPRFDSRLRDCCAECERYIEQPATGRTRIYCSAACRQSAYRHRVPGDETAARAAEVSP